VKKARIIYEKSFIIKPIAPLSNEVPSNKFVIQTGLTLDTKITANPNVQTTVRELFRLYLNSSNLVIIDLMPTSVENIID